jgi:hypothetical protein
MGGGNRYSGAKSGDAKNPAGRRPALATGTPIRRRQPPTAHGAEEAELQ